MNKSSLQGRPLSVHSFAGPVTRQENDNVVDLTQAMQNALGKFALNERNIVLRVDALPMVAFDEVKAVQLCYLLLQSVFKWKHSSKLLLSVKCDSVSDGSETDRSGQEFHRLSFQVNFGYSLDWHQQSMSLLQECNDLLAQTGGKVEVN